MKKARILIVEDELIIAVNLKETVEGLGYDVQAIVSSGEEAIEKSEEIKPDLILMDIVLSDKMDGIDAAKIIMERLKIPVIYLTAHSDKLTLERAKATEPYGYVLKPINPQELYVTIEVGLYKHGMERKLKESEERYRMLVETMNDGVCIIDAKGLITYINDRFYTRFGYSYGEIIGRPMLELFNDKNRRIIIEQFDRRQRGEDEPYELEWNLKGGGTMYSIVSPRGIFDEDGVFQGSLVVVTDITDRKRAEEKLRESEERYRLIVENMPVLICRFLPETGIITFVNEEYCKYFKKSYEEIVGQSFLGLIPEREHQEVKDYFESLNKDNPVITYEYQVNTPNGVRWQRWIDQALFDEYDNVIEYQSIGMDITDRKLAEERIRESELRYRELFENMSSGVAVYRPGSNGEDFIFLDFNKAGERIDNIKKENIIGKNVLQVFPGVREFGLFEVFQKVYRTGDAESYPVSLYRDDRIMGWRDNYVYKLPTGEIVAIYDDVTEKVQMENERNRVYLELDQIFNTTSVGMCLIDREFTITKANNTFLKMFELEMGDVIGNKCYSIWKEHRCNMDFCPLTRVLGSNIPYKFEVKRDRDVKDDIICMVSAVPYLSDDGDVVGVLESFTDITEVRELEKEIIGISQEERKSIGQDLHDDLGQKLSYIGFLAEVVKRKMAEQSYDVADIGEIINLVGDSIDNIRSISKGLYPVEMNPHGFIAAIEELAESTGRLLGVNCELDRVGDLHIDDNTVATNLYYIIQESISNAIKHGKAKNIRIQVKSDNNRLNLMVEDDGSGAQPEEMIGKGMGLRIMKYRADLIGAEFEARGTEKGFSVWVGLRVEV
jgi:PAS domain S-box-containing protein